MELINKKWEYFEGPIIQQQQHQQTQEQLSSRKGELLLKL